MSLGTILLVVVAGSILSGCYEAASTYDDKRGRYVSTDEYKKQYGVTEVCQSSSCYDAKSGHMVSRDEWNARQRDSRN